MSKRSVGQVLECAELVPFCLSEPKAIFEGLRLDEDEKYSDGPGWRCYSSRPQYAYTEDGDRADPYGDEVFLVFVNHDRIVYNWRWEPANLDDLHVPMDLGGDRFRRQIYP